MKLFGIKLGIILATTVVVIIIFRIMLKLIFGFLIMIAPIDDITIRQTKDFAIMYVEEDDVVDGDVMLYPPEKFSVLELIDIEMREKVSEYMKEHNYKLKDTTQRFIVNDPTFEELIVDGFEFEEID